MKHLVTIIFWGILNQTFAQNKITQRYSEISKMNYDNCSNLQIVFNNPLIKKVSGKLIVTIENKSREIFIDNNSLSNFVEHEYLGDYKELKLSLVKAMGYNDEIFYLVHHSTGKVDTLIGQPVFADNKINFVCTNKPGTDQKQRLQVCEIKGGIVKTRGYLSGITNTFIEELNCIQINSLAVKDNKGKYWKLDFAIN